MSGLDEELVLVGPVARQVEHQRLVAPHQDVVRGRGDLVGERLATRRRLGDLEQQAGREDALVVEPGEVDGLDAGQFVDRWHDADDATGLGCRSVPTGTLRKNVSRPRHRRRSP